MFRLQTGQSQSGQRLPKDEILADLWRETRFRQKAQLVEGGHLVDVLDNDSYSLTVKGVSFKILHVVAHQQGQNPVWGDVINAFVQAYTNKKVHAVAGLEFGLELVGKIVIVWKTLYGLASSSKRWHSHFPDTLRGLNFVPTRSDANV
jgi:hypothetical protein